MRMDNFADQVKIFDPQTWGWPVHLIGAGGINNLVGAVLVKMGIRELHIWDDDVLEARNLPTEVGYSAAMCGQPKTAAMTDLIHYLVCGTETVRKYGEHGLEAEGITETETEGVTGTDTECPDSEDTRVQETVIGDLNIRIYEHRERVTAETELDGVVISGVDSMASRKEIWRAVQNNYLEIPFYIDARSGGEEFQIFAFSPADFETAEAYKTWLFDDSEATQLECGARNIGYIAATVAGEIGRLVTMFHRGIEIRDFPVIRNLADY